MQQDLTWPSMQNVFQIWGFWGLFQAIRPFYKDKELPYTLSLLKKTKKKKESLLTQQGPKGLV